MILQQEPLLLVKWSVQLILTLVYLIYYIEEDTLRISLSFLCLPVLVKGREVENRTVVSKCPGTSAVIKPYKRMRIAPEHAAYGSETYMRHHVTDNNGSLDTLTQVVTLVGTHGFFLY